METSEVPGPLESRLGVGSRFAFTIPKDQPTEDPLPNDEIDEFGADPNTRVGM